ncbi:hypothetical protein HY604_00340 [Candidatus Peregrinibacteria bacterium]|nr:hypothetical protein [Candidatus Peregrinibacteria bacterium]
MQKSTKIIIGLLGVVLIGFFVFYFGGGSAFQGRLSKDLGGKSSRETAKEETKKTEEERRKAAAEQTGSNLVALTKLSVSAATDLPTSYDVTAGNGQEVMKVDFIASGSKNPHIMAIAFTIDGTAILSNATANGSAKLLNNSGEVKASEDYVSAASDGSASSGTEIAFNNSGSLSGIPVGSTVLISHSSDGVSYARKIVSITNAGLVTFVPQIAGFDDGYGDTLSYVPLQPGFGKLYFGAASTLNANLENGANVIQVSSTNGFALGDYIAIRGANSVGLIIECTSEVNAVPSSNFLVVSPVVCTNGESIDYDNGGMLAVVFSGSIEEEIVGTESMLVRGDLTGANSASAGSRTVQFSIDAANDVSWYADMPEVGSNLQDYNSILQSINNSNFPVSGNVLEFKS